MKKIIKILSILSLCASFDITHCMMRSCAPKLERNFSSRFVGANNRFTQFLKDKWQKVCCNPTAKCYCKKGLIGVAGIGASLYTLSALNKIKTKNYTYTFAELDQAPFESTLTPHEAISLQQPHFQKSKEEELEESISLLMEHDNISYEQAKNWWLSTSSLLNNTKNFFSLTDDILSEKNPEFTEIFKDIQKSFDQLKIIFHIPDEVKIVFNIDKSKNSSSPAEYNSLDRIVILNKLVLYTNKSLQLQILVHELMHVRQHMENGLWKHLLMYITNTMLVEHDADLKAFWAINCPLCLQEGKLIDRIKADTNHEKFKNFEINTRFSSILIYSDFRKKMYKDFETDKNYLSGYELLLLGKVKSTKNLCKAHIDEITDLNDFLKSTAKISLQDTTKFQETIKLLNEKSKKQQTLYIKTTDITGSLYDHLSTVRFDEQDK